MVAPAVKTTIASSNKKTAMACEKPSVMPVSTPISSIKPWPEAYQSLTPLSSFFYPALKLIGKEKQPNGRSKKIYEKIPKTPCQRLLESADLSEKHYTGLYRIA